ncbi:MAG TPA: Gfo/Idh/MocA family oxidoreductase [Pirellulales bacterium]|nr:Gfo/Idh/MocA family oxidoreductase [Pirellulales bacterium]
MTRAVNRREFLTHTAATGAALAVWSEAAAAEANKAANDRLVVAVMGVNGRGSALASSFAAQPNAAVAYICDVDERAIAKGMQAVAKHQQDQPVAIGDFRKALDDPAIDALVIAAPDHWHAPATILACAAGKHVYVEKPACHNGREGELMIAAARNHKRSVQLGSQRRSSPGIAEAISRMQKGEIGRVLFARSWINSIRPSIGHGQKADVPSWLNYELWQGPAPDRAYRDNLVHYNWHWFWHYGTGELGNNGIHGLDVCRWGLGVDYPQRVVCGGGRFHFDDDQETPDTQVVTYNFGDKAINWEHRTWNKRGFENESFGVVFYGENGSIVITGRGYKVLDKDGKEIASGDAGYPEGVHIANFLASIRTGEQLNAEIEEGVKSTAMCHLGNIAYRTGRTVNFDASAKKIVGDEEQTALWSREYRKGWEPQV